MRWVNRYWSCPSACTSRFGMPPYCIGITDISTWGLTHENEEIAVLDFNERLSVHPWSASNCAKLASRCSVGSLLNPDLTNRCIRPIKKLTHKLALC
jgi:hypothetical protein